MKINELEKILNISRANIRFYEKEGLINPSRKENGYREYSDKDVSLLKKIIIYRKLGISVADIKSIFDGNISLQNALEKSISSMQDEISRLSVSSEICKELQDKNVDDMNFDEEYYWEEINSREASGEEFFDISNIDTSGFDNRKRVSVVIAVFAVLFFIGIAYAMFCGVIVRDDNDYYDEIQSEIETYSKIDTVKIDTENDRIYVCYEQASCVNVYNMYGEFLWAVSTPFVENSRGITYFYIDNGRLILDWTDTYVYNAITGGFIEKTYSEKLGILDWRNNWETDHEKDLAAAKEFGFSFDEYNVYKTDADGNIINYIVEKPSWYIITDQMLGFIIALISAAVLSAVIIINKFKLLQKVPLNKNEMGKLSKIFVAYLRILFSCLIIYSVFNITLAFFNITFLLICIFPVAIVFILTLILSDILKKRFNNSEQKVCGMWRIYNIIGFVLAFISEIMAICITQ